MGEIETGAYVHYKSPHGSKENGRVKSINGDTAFVVFNCAGEWEHYRDYTGQSTKIADLSYGWVDEKGKLGKEFCDHHYIPTNAKWQSANQARCCFCGDIIN